MQRQAARSVPTTTSTSRATGQCRRVFAHAGVNNLLDKDPPLLSSGGLTSGITGPLNGNTFPGVYDPLGRYIFVGGTLKL